MNKYIEENNSEQIQTDEDSIIKSQMEKMVDSYDDYMRKITFGKEKKLRELTIDLAGIKSGDNVLEIGCGTGSLTLESKRKVGSTGKAYGIDIISGMIDRSKHKAKEASLDVNFQLGSIDNIPFPDNQFDAVMCSFMIFHMSEEVRKKGLNEIFRVLKPRGHLLILDLNLPSGHVSRILMKLFLGFMFKHDLNELLPLMDSIGFTKSELKQMNFRVFGLPMLSYLYGIKKEPRYC